MNNICKIGIKKLYFLIKNKKISYFDLINNCLNNFNKINKKNIFSINNKLKVKNFIKNIDKKKIYLPISIKNIYINKKNTNYSNSLILKYDNFNYNSIIIKILKKHNFLILSNDNLEEFCVGGSGISCKKTKNLYNKKIFVGGSSTGSAISVLSGSVLASIGSDTGGSVRTPAEFCKLVGFKPTNNLISRHGMIPYSSFLDNCSILTNNVEDCEFIFKILISKNNDNYLSFKKIKFLYKKKKIAILILKNFEIEFEIKNSIEILINNFYLIGYFIELIEINYNYIFLNYDILSSKEFYSNTLRYDGIKFGYFYKYYKNINDLIKNNRIFNKSCKEKIIKGAHYNYDSININLFQIEKLFNCFFKKVDFIIIPNTIIKNNFTKYINYFDYLTIISNMIRLPSISLPTNLNNHQKISFQIIGREYSDFDLLNIAKEYEECYFNNETFA